MAKILLTRHGHVDGIKPERFRGRANLALTDKGRREALALARRIVSAWSPLAIYTSPMQRCVATGEAIASACGVRPLILDDLNDINYGTWQFKTYDNVRADFPELFPRWFKHPHLMRFPDGEALQDVAARAANVLRSVLDRHNGDIIVLVGHDCFNRVMLTQLLDWPLSSYWRLTQEPCCLNEIDFSLETVHLHRLNDIAHLADGALPYGG